MTRFALVQIITANIAAGVIMTTLTILGLI